MKCMVYEEIQAILHCSLTNPTFNSQMLCFQVNANCFVNNYPHSLPSFIYFFLFLYFFSFFSFFLFFFLFLYSFFPHFNFSFFFLFYSFIQKLVDQFLYRDQISTTLLPKDYYLIPSKITKNLYTKIELVCS